MRFEHFEHGADVGVRGYGSTPAQAFEQAARALFALLAEDLSRVRPLAEEHFSCEAETMEDLLVAFLNELISLAATRRMVFGSFQLTIGEEPAGTYRLSCVAPGEPFDPSRHESTVEPKGATYTQLKVALENGRWVAQCVVDV